MENNFYHLTKREIEILLLIAKGKENCEIAGILFISPLTVGTHKAHLIKNLNLKSTAELTCYAALNKVELEKVCELIAS